MQAQFEPPKTVKSNKYDSPSFPYSIKLLNTLVLKLGQVFFLSTQERIAHQQLIPNIEQLHLQACLIWMLEEWPASSTLSEMLT